MTGLSLDTGLLIELMVALLLIMTIGYCAVLNRKLVKLRQDETALRQLVGDLIDATSTAETAIATLKSSASDWDRALGGRLRKADQLNTELDERIVQSEDILGQLREICMAAAATAKPAAPTQRNTAAPRNAAPQRNVTPMSGVGRAANVSQPVSNAQPQRTAPPELSGKARQPISQQSPLRADQFSLDVDELPLAPETVDNDTGFRDRVGPRVARR